MMKTIDFLILLTLMALLFFSGYLLLDNLPATTVGFVKYERNFSEFSQEFPVKSSQFYPNMRYSEKNIAYSLSENCDEKRKAEIERAFQILISQTNLNFYKSKNSQIIISCSNLSPRPEQKDYFIAGEGGPTEIINSTAFAVILSGKISFYRRETCQSPQIALHEILHALGFDHNSNENSIMFPVTNCNQTIDKYITEEINRLYSIPSAGDLVIEKLTANKSGRYINFETDISNYGLKDIKNSSLILLANNQHIKEFFLGEIPLGSKKHLQVTNLRVPKETEAIKIIVETKELEIEKENNFAEISIIE